jgi:hypothetical protein
MRNRGRPPVFTGKLAEKVVKMLSQYGIARGGWQRVRPQGLFELLRWQSPGGQQLPEEEAFAELEGGEA